MIVHILQQLHQYLEIFQASMCGGKRKVHNIEFKKISVINPRELLSVGKKNSIHHFFFCSQYWHEIHGFLLSQLPDGIWMTKGYKLLAEEEQEKQNYSASAVNK